MHDLTDFCRWLYKKSKKKKLMRSVESSRLHNGSTGDTIDLDLAEEIRDLKLEEKTEK